MVAESWRLPRVEVAGVSWGLSPRLLRLPQVGVVVAPWGCSPRAGVAWVAAAEAAEGAWVFAMMSRLIFERFEDGFAQAAARVRGVGCFVDAVLDELFADGIIDREAIVGREVLEVRGQVELFEERLLFRSKWHRFPFVVRENYSILPTNTLSHAVQLRARPGASWLDQAERVRHEGGFLCSPKDGIRLSRKLFFEDLL